MKKKKYFDNNILRKSAIIKNSLQFIKGTNIPLPSLIEISDSGTCNRQCSFCPRSDPGYKDIKEFISKNLHSKIMKELCSIDYTGLIIYSGFNEPLLNKRAYEQIAEARNLLPEAKIELITNGDVLNEERLKKLFISGLSTLLISVYDGPEDMVKFEKMCKSAKLNKKQYIIRKRYLPPEEDYGITISNRGGLMQNAKHTISPLKKSLQEKCNYPSYTFFIDYNGDVLMCSHDWGKKQILGNLYKSSIIEIWTSEKSMEVRNLLINGKRNFSPCNVCDVKGDLIGSSHAEAWSKVLKKNKEIAIL